MRNKLLESTGKVLMKKKVNSYQKKFGQTIKDISFSYDVNLFQDSVQVVFSLLSQILGLDNDKLVIEVILGFLMKLSHSESKSKFLNFDEFLDRIIHA